MFNLAPFVNASLSFHETPLSSISVYQDIPVEHFEPVPVPDDPFQHRLLIESPFPDGDLPPFAFEDIEYREVPLLPLEIKETSLPRRDIHSTGTAQSATEAELPRRDLVNVSAPHIPVLWAALNIALGQDLRAQVVRGLPCITRSSQLFCRSGGSSYPSDHIKVFIDDNKALIRRMYGEFISLSSRRKRSLHDDPGNFNEYDEFEEGVFAKLNSSDIIEGGEPSENQYANIIRHKRQVGSPGPLPASSRKDVCESEEEIATPYWASNSRGKILAIVNTNEFSQIVHQEICTHKATKRCRGKECGCEQKYKYHRLMAYDPDNDCKGIYMDWFLFPSCCVCRCDP